MPRNGSGTYVQPGGTTAGPSGAVISSSAQNSLVTDIGQEITNSLPTTGVKGMAADLPMGGFKITGLGTPTLTTDGATKAYVDSAVGGATTTQLWYGGASAGTANAQTVATLTPASPAFALTAGNRIGFIPVATNTSAFTLQPLALLATAVKKMSGSGLQALSGGEIVVGQMVEVIYDGTQFVLVNNALQSPGAVATLASGGTTDLGTIPSRNVSITGTTTITAFGSTALTAYPIYFLAFTGALTLTHNATSLILPGAANITTAAGDTAIANYLGSGNWRVVSYTPASGASVVAGASAGVLLAVQTFTASGTYTPTAGATRAKIMACGPGGTGAGRTAAGTGGGGGAGEARWGVFTVAAASPVAITIGAAPAATTGVVAIGSDTVVGALMTCKSGSPGAATSTRGADGTGGSGGTTVFPGLQPGAGPNFVVGGSGSWGPFGAGGMLSPSATLSSGPPGVGYGAGGSGAVSTGSNLAGGKGSDGVVLIEEYR